MEKKGAIPFYIVAIVIAVAVLTIVMISYFVLKEKGVSLIDQIKNLFKFG